MGIGAARRGASARSNGRRQRTRQVHPEGVKLLRLDLLTILEQIRILDHELAADPCLTTDGIAVIVSLVDSLKQELADVRRRIQELKGTSTA